MTLEDYDDPNLALPTGPSEGQDDGVRATDDLLYVCRIPDCRSCFWTVEDAARHMRTVHGVAVTAEEILFVDEQREYREQKKIARAAGSAPATSPDQREPGEERLKQERKTES